MNSILKKGVSLGTFVILCSVGFDADAQTIRSYGDKAESQYGASSAGPTALPGAPAPRASTPSKVNTPQGQKAAGEESGEGEPDYESPVTVFRRSGGSKEELEQLDLKPEEMYRGVIPGTRDEVEHLEGAKKVAARGTNRLTWIGFQPRDQSTRVFLQTVNEPNYEVSNQGSTVVLTLSNTKLSARNFSRFIDTTYFDRIVNRIESKQVNRSTVEVTIQLKQSERPRVNATSNYVYLDFSGDKMASENKEDESNDDTTDEVTPTALDE